MINDLITLLGFDPEYEFLAMFISVIIVSLIFVQFLNIINYIFKSIGGLQ